MFFNQMEILLLVWYNNCKENLNMANSYKIERLLLYGEVAAFYIF